MLNVHGGSQSKDSVNCIAVANQPSHGLKTVYNAAKAISPAPTAPPIAQGAFETTGVAPAVLEEVLEVEGVAVTVTANRVSIALSTSRCGPTHQSLAASMYCSLSW